MNLSRRNLLTGLTAFIAAPAIIRVAGIMPVKAWASDAMPELFITGPIDPDRIDLRPGAVTWVTHDQRFYAFDGMNIHRLGDSYDDKIAAGFKVACGPDGILVWQPPGGHVGMQRG